MKTWVSLRLSLLVAMLACMAQAQTDSIVQITAEAYGLPQVAREDLPPVGTFWEMLPNGIMAPLPCPPLDDSLPVYQMANGLFLVDATGGKVSVKAGSLTSKTLSAAVEAQGNAVADLIERTQGAALTDSLSAMSAMDTSSLVPEGGISYAPMALSSPVDYGTNLWIAYLGMTNGSLAAIGSNTMTDVQYEIQCCTNLTQADWQFENFIYGSSLTNWTPLSVAQNGRTNLFIRLRSWISSDGSGLPDWWQQLYGVSDPYGDPDEDGWNNLQEFQNGTNPKSFDTPQTPVVRASFNQNNNLATVSWLPMPGPVTNYLVQKYDYQTSTATYMNFPTGTTGFQDDLSYDVSQGMPYFYVGYSVQAQYAPGNSDWGMTYVGYGTFDFNPILVTGPQGRPTLLIQNSPSDLSLVRVYRDFGFGPPETLAVNDYLQWDLLDSLFPALDTDYFDIPASRMTNGICQFDDSKLSPFFGYAIWMQTVRSNGVASDWTYVSGLTVSKPFADARRQLKDNLQFVFRAGTFEPFRFDVRTGAEWWEANQFLWSPDHVASGFYNSGDGNGLSFDELRPFYDNYFLRNFAFDTNRLASNGFLNTGCYIAFPWWYLQITNYPAYYFDSANFIADTNAPMPASQLDISKTQWILPKDGDVYDWSAGTMQSVTNCYGLSLISVKGAYVTNGALILAEYHPGDPTPGGVQGVRYVDLASPGFQLANYYFAIPNSDPMPETAGFATTNKTRMFIQAIGTSQQFAGYAKLAVTNGYPGVYGYLGQYFDGACKVDENGNVTTNTTGILSPYGDFFATEPGLVGLQTMADLDTGARGVCPVRVIGLNVDGNHDGTMDYSFNGPDAASWASPFRFWVNDNHDVEDDGGNYGIPGYAPASQADGSRVYIHQTSVSVPGSPYATAIVDAYGVHGRRDLVDYFPVYLNIGSLFQSNSLSAGIDPNDTSYQYALSQADEVLRFVYTDLTSTNYMDFLRDTNESGKLTSPPAIAWPVLARGICLDRSFVNNIATNNGGILLVEAAAPTTAPLVLTIYHGTNMVAQTELPLSITGVEQMFRHKNLLPGHSNATPRGPLDRLEDASVPNEPKTTDKNFVFLHGYNVNPNEARGVQADMYKRMYWAGSQAKFYGVTWKGADSKIGSILTPNYHTNVANAFMTAPLLADFIATLTNSGPVVAAAHSLGNMVVLSAISDWNAPISQYFMMDAAVPIEAIDPVATTNMMVYSTWQDYSNRLFASDWYRLFPTNDARNTLSWNNRLGNLGTVDVYNFYSSGEEVLRTYIGDPPSGVLNMAGTQVFDNLWSGVPFGTGTWYWQEKGKGTCTQDWFLGSSHGGWRFSDYYYAVPVVSANSTAYTPDSMLQQHPFFDFSRAALVGPPHPDLALTNSSTGSAYAAANRNRILADAIPAMSLVVGANPVPSFDNNHNLNMNTPLFQNGWSAGRTGDEAGKWHHSDFVQIAYPFTYKLFNQFVTTGNLK